MTPEQTLIYTVVSNAGSKGEYFKHSGAGADGP